MKLFSYIYHFIFLSLIGIGFLFVFPSLLETEKFSILILIFIIPLILFPLFLHYKRKRDIQFLQTHGLRIQATITKIKYFDWSGRSGKKWKILCQGKYKGKTRFFSTLVYKNPEKLISPGDTLMIFVHPKDPERYIIQHNLPSQYT